MPQFTIGVLGKPRKPDGGGRSPCPRCRRMKRPLLKLTINAPDRDVAIYRAKQAGFEVVER